VVLRLRSSSLVFGGIETEEGYVIEAFRLVKGDPEDNADSIRGPVTDLDGIIDGELVHFGREGKSLAKTPSQSHTLKRLQI
jgi:hypothetical protein